MKSGKVVNFDLTGATDFFVGDGLFINNCAALYLKVPLRIVSRVELLLTNGTNDMWLMVYKKLGRLGKITVKPRAWWGYMNLWIDSVKKGFTGLKIRLY